MKNIIIVLLMAVSVFYSYSLAESVGIDFIGPVIEEKIKVNEYTAIKWLGNSGFQITTPNDNVILIDPWLSNPMVSDVGIEIDKVDLVLVTQGHPDHFGETTEIIKKTGAILCTYLGLGIDAVENRGVPKEKATLSTLLDIGGKVQFFKEEVEISMVMSTHSSGGAWKKSGNLPSKQANKSVGFIISIKDGPVIYHTGDTGLFGDLRLIRNLYHPNILLLPIGGHFTMGPELAAQAVKMISPTWVIPMHYDTYPFQTGTPEKFYIEMMKLNLKTDLIVLEPGEFADF